jgi:putative ABC transport system permease protein
LELLKEIYASLRRNPLRSILTAFGVSWGLFMLILNLGLGKGLENGVQTLFKGFSTNNLFVWGQATSMPYAGFTEGRRIRLGLDDIDYVKERVDGLKIIAPRAQLGGYGEGNNVKYKNETGAFSIQGDIPDVRKVYQWVQVDGRFINETDLKESRKVCSIGKRVKEVLFKGQNPVGEYISMNGVQFMVVGCHKSPTAGERAEQDEQQIIIPMSTYQKAFDGSNKINWMAVVCHDDYDAQEVEDNIKAALRVKHKVHPDDPRGLGGFNAKKMFGPMQMTFLTVRVVAWFVGLMTLIAGIIGVSNIMIVTVKERTKEIGIRRAIGAKPRNIVVQIIAEALMLTIFAGYFGLMGGIWVVEGIGRVGVEGQMFKDPSVEMPVALTALFVLVLAGCLAGLLPANRALRIKPVEALRYE